MVELSPMSDTPSTKISVVIPALNEEGAIEETILAVKTMAAKAGIAAVEIVVINDGSTDKTGEIAERAGATVVHHLERLGYGRSLKDGIIAAAHDTIVITDADGTYPIDMIPTLLAEYDRGYHMVVGARRGEHYKESWLKMPLRKLLRFIVEFTAGQRVPDVNSGLRVFGKADILPFFGQLCNTFSFTTSMTLAFMMTGRFVKYISIDYHERIGTKKVKLLKDSLRTLQYIVQAALYYNPLKIFLLCCFGTMGFAAFCFAGAFLTKLTSLFFLGVGSVLITLLIFSLGLISDQLRQLLLQDTRQFSDQGLSFRGHIHRPEVAKRAVNSDRIGK